MSLASDARETWTAMRSEFDSADPGERMMYRFLAVLAAVVALILIIGILTLLFKLAMYLIPGLIVAGAVYWWLRRKNTK